MATRFCLTFGLRRETMRRKNKKWFVFVFVFVVVVVEGYLVTVRVDDEMERACMPPTKNKK
jgi:hypothetical protein